MWYYFCAVFTVISSAVSLYFSIEAVRQSKRETQTNAKYALSRSLTIFLVALVPLFLISKLFLVALAVIMIGIQFMDGIIGLKISLFKTVGPLFTLVVNFVFLILLLILK